MVILGSLKRFTVYRTCVFLSGRRQVHAEREHLRRGRPERGLRRDAQPAARAQRPRLPAKQPLQPAAAVLHQRSAGEKEGHSENGAVSRFEICKPAYLQRGTLS